MDFPVALSNLILCHFSALIYSKPSPTNATVDNTKGKSVVNVTTWCRSNLTDQTGTVARGYYGISVLIPQEGKNSYRKWRQKIRQGQNVIQNDTNV